MKKIIIVGGVAGGASAAARLRRLDEQAEIIIIERGEHISFANCGLPYYIGEVITDRDRLLLQTPQSMNARFNLDVRVLSEVAAVHAADKKVTIISQERGEYEETYDYLILSPGAKPIRPAISGIDSAKIMTLRNIADTDRIKQVVDEAGTKRAIVVGGGFIGVEMAENLRERGLEVSLIEAAPHILAPFDADMVTLAEKEMTEHGVELLLGDSVQSFQDDGTLVHVNMKSGRTRQAELVILAIGVVPDTGFLRNSGVTLGPRGHIVVDKQMRTNLSDVYAVGDAIEIVDFVLGSKGAIPLAGPANRQGRIAADQICNLPSTYKGTQGSAIVKIFGLTAASTGSNERALTQAGIPYKAVYVHPASHAGYYPGSGQIALKLLFGKSGEILGTQALGTSGVDKRIDVIATVMRLKGTVYDLAELELTYAPPYSSAKDPVQMAAYQAMNVLDNLTDTISAAKLQEIAGQETVVLDVRTDAEYERGHIRGAVHIPVDQLRERLNELNTNKLIIAYCAVGMRGYIASRILCQSGYQVKNLSGGFRSYTMYHYKPTPKEV